MLDKVQKNLEKEQEKEYKKQLERCIPFAKLVLKTVLEADLDMGDNKDLDEKKYQDTGLKVIAALMESNVAFTDRQFIFQLALQPISKIQELVVESLTKSFNIASEKKWGKDMMDITINDINNVLKQK